MSQRTAEEEAREFIERWFEDTVHGLPEQPERELTALLLRREREVREECLVFLRDTQFNHTYEEMTCHFCDLLWNPEWEAALKLKDGSDRKICAKIHAPDCRLGNFIHALSPKEGA